MNQRIMAVDDSDIAQDFIRTTLADIGFPDVVGYMNPREALDAIETGATAADLILLDIMMPEMDGIELCARIRGIDAWTDVPIIMLTSRKDMESLSKAFMAGANDFVTKPFSRVELQARMRSCLRLKSELDRRRAGEVRSRRDRKAEAAQRSNASDVIGTKAGFTANLMAMSPLAQSRLGLIAIKIDALHGEADAAVSLSPEIREQVSRLLGSVRIKAGDTFAHWDDDLFCYATLDSTVDDLERCARQFIQVVADASIVLPESWEKGSLSISAAIVPPSREATSTALVEAINTLDITGKDGRGRVIRVTPGKRSG